jgi:hypothetical protein
MKMDKIFAVMAEARKARALLLENVAVNQKGEAYLDMPHPYGIYCYGISLGDVVQIIQKEFPEVKEVIAHFCGQLNLDGPIPVKVISLTVEEEAQRVWRYMSTPMNEFPEIPGLHWAFYPRKK